MTSSENFDAGSKAEATAWAIHQYLKTLPSEPNRANAYHVLALAYGHQTWNHMSAAIKPKDAQKNIELKGNQAADTNHQLNWPICHTQGIHLIVCQQNVPIADAGSRAISALIRSRESRLLLEQGHSWRMTFNTPGETRVRAVIPTPGDENPGFELIDSLPVSRIYKERFADIRRAAKQADADDKPKLFETEVFFDLDLDLADGCQLVALSKPVIVVINAADAAGGLVRLGELHFERLALCNPMMIRQIDVISALEPSIVIAETYKSDYDTLYRLLAGRKIDLVPDERVFG